MNWKSRQRKINNNKKNRQEEQGDVEIGFQERIKTEWGRGGILEVKCYKQ